LKIFVIGNGQSREGFALNQLKDFTIGCNAIHRDFTCDEYVAVDRRMVDEILRNDKNKGCPIYTREDWVDQYKKRNNVLSLPALPFSGVNKSDQPFHWNSGPYAILVAALKNPEQITLLGFDLWSKTSFVNNIYKGTPNYAGAHDRRVTPDFWIYQLSKLFNHFNNIQFVQMQLENWRIPDQWKDIRNLTITKL
jgi:hypothetical protein